MIKKTLIHSSLPSRQTQSPPIASLFLKSCYSWGSHFFLRLIWFLVWCKFKRCGSHLQERETNNQPFSFPDLRIWIRLRHSTHTCLDLKANYTHEKKQAASWHLLLHFIDGTIKSITKTRIDYFIHYFSRNVHDDRVMVIPASRVLNLDSSHNLSYSMEIDWSISAFIHSLLT